MIRLLLPMSSRLPDPAPCARRLGGLRAAAALVLLLGAAQQAAASGMPPGCSGAVPSVLGVDQSPTAPQDYGTCVSVEPYFQNTSNWCTSKGFNSWPTAPPATAAACLKFGRLSVYTGPVSRPRDTPCTGGPLVLDPTG